MGNKYPRPIVVAAIKHPDGRYFANPGEDRIKGYKFYRFCGGGIEFGETAADALRREFMEEFGVRVIPGRQIGIVENIFEFEGAPGHEIVFILEAEFEDKKLYDMEKIPLIEEEFSGKFCTWVNALPGPKHFGVIG